MIEITTPNALTEAFLRQEMTAEATAALAQVKTTGWEIGRAVTESLEILAVERDALHQRWLRDLRENGLLDPDGPPAPPAASKPAFSGEHERQEHDFIGALYRPYQAPI